MREIDIDNAIYRLRRNSFRLRLISSIISFNLFILLILCGLSFYYVHYLINIGGPIISALCVFLLFVFDMVRKNASVDYEIIGNILEEKFRDNPDDYDIRSVRNYQWDVSYAMKKFRHAKNLPLLKSETSAIFYVVIFLTLGLIILFIQRSGFLKGF